MNAQEKLERAQRHAEDKKHSSQQTIERLQREYEEMALERRDNDKQMEELRKEANDVIAKVCPPSFYIINAYQRLLDDGASEEKRSRTKWTFDWVLEAETRDRYIAIHAYLNQWLNYITEVYMEILANKLKLKVSSE